MEKQKLGSPTSEKQGTKDCIHFPIVALLFEETPLPGMPVVISQDMKTGEYCRRGKPHGYVDPFLSECNHGSTVWVLVDPFFVGGLRHEYECNIPHPGDNNIAKNPEGILMTRLSTNLAPLPAPDYYPDSYDECRGCN